MLLMMVLLSCALESELSTLQMFGQMLVMMKMLILSMI